MAEARTKAIILTEADIPGAKLTKLPAESSVLELKRWLECHGEKKSGNKPDLIRRVEGCLAIKKKVDPKVDGGKWYDIKAANGSSNKPSTSGSAPTVAGSQEEDGWKQFPSRNLPAMFNYGHVYHYLIESVSEMFLDESSGEDSDDCGPDTEDTATAKPLRKGRKLVKSEFVENIHDNEDGNDYCVRAHVHHSMKNDLPLNVKVTLSKTSGYVKKATCTCKARALGRCAHITAILLMLDDYTKEHGSTVKEPSTSQPCSWNKGKKRKKNPEALHKAEYKSRNIRSNKELYNWDPRPADCRNIIDQTLLNGFIGDLQTDSANRGAMSMWETALRIKYADFEIDDEDKPIIQALVNEFESGLREEISKTTAGSQSACQVPNTEEQSNNDKWFQARWPRVTASTCKEVANMGENLLSGEDNDCRNQHYRWINNKLWNPQFIMTLDMLYGLKEEPAARAAYSKANGNKVINSGIWINNKYPHLGASPDGLILDKDSGKATGIIEIKCLKVLKTRTVDELIKACQDDNSSNVLKNQCFTVRNGKLCLRKIHAYYYQVQLQLLITELDFCDFILHTPKGQPAIECILPDTQLQQKIVRNTKAFWQRIFVPEYFLMKVPRRLLPAVL